MVKEKRLEDLYHARKLEWRPKPTTKDDEEMNSDTDEILVAAVVEEEVKDI